MSPSGPVTRTCAPVGQPANADVSVIRSSCRPPGAGAMDVVRRDTGLRGGYPSRCPWAAVESQSQPNWRGPCKLRPPKMACDCAAWRRFCYGGDIAPASGTGWPTRSPPPSSDIQRYCRNMLSGPGLPIERRPPACQSITDQIDASLASNSGSIQARGTPNPFRHPLTRFCIDKGSVLSTAAGRERYGDPLGPMLSDNWNCQSPQRD
jgi:hypothetical protein